MTTKNVPPLDALFDRTKKLIESSGINCYHFDGVSVNPSIESIEEAKEFASRHEVDVVLAVGGGSTIDTAKMISFEYKEDKIYWDKIFSLYNRPFADTDHLKKDTLPIIAVPTTSGTGSQVTQCAVITRRNKKHGIFHNSMFPSEAIIDPELMLTLPSRTTASSGFDAFCHACETFLKPTASSLSRIYSEKAMELIVEYLPKVMGEPDNLFYRMMMAQADLFAGIALSNVGGYIVHPLSDLVGSIVTVDHGQALAFLLPSFIRVIHSNDIKSFAKLSRILNRDNSGLDDKQSAEVCAKEVEAFMGRISMDLRLADFSYDQESLLGILNGGVLDEIPFASRDDLKKILNLSIGE